MDFNQNYNINNTNNNNCNVSNKSFNVCIEEGNNKDNYNIYYPFYGNPRIHVNHLNYSKNESYVPYQYHYLPSYNLNLNKNTLFKITITIQNKIFLFQILTFISN